MEKRGDVVNRKVEVVIGFLNLRVQILKKETLNAYQVLKPGI